MNKKVSHTKIQQLYYILGITFLECMSKKRQELEEELGRIEQRCLRQKAPRAKENNPEANDNTVHVEAEQVYILIQSYMGSQIPLKI